MSARFILGDDVGETGFDPHSQQLVGLATMVTEDFPFDVFLTEEGEVDEGHAPGAIAKDEEVAGEFEGGVAAQIHFQELENGGFVNGALAGGIDTGIYSLKGTGLPHQMFLDGVVVDGSPYTHIEGDAVAGQPAIHQPVVVPEDQFLIHHAEGQILVVQEGGETVEGATVVVDGAVFSPLPQQGDLPLHIFQDFHLGGGQIEFADDLFHGIGFIPFFEIVDDAAKHIEIVCYLLTIILQILFVVVACQDFAVDGIPVFRVDVDGCRNLFTFLLVTHLIIDGAGFVLH